MCAMTFARDYQGNLGQRIKQAYDALPSEGGVIDARDQGGDQVIAEPLALGGNWTKTVTLLLGRTNIRVRGTITLGRSCAIVGEPAGAWVWEPRPAGADPVGTHLIAESPMPALIDIGDPTGKRGAGYGTTAALKDLTLHGGDGVMFAVVRISGGAQRTDLHGVSVLGSRAHGIAVESAGVCKFTKVVTRKHDRPNCAGVYVVTSNDLFISESELNSNFWGVALVNSGAMRFIQNDVSGNADSGIALSGMKSTDLTAVGNQFALNGGHDIDIDTDPGGWGGHVISANRFFGSGKRADNKYAAIRLRNVTAATVTGNFIQLGVHERGRPPARFYAGIHAFATPGGRSLTSITSNALRGAVGDGGPIAHTADDVVTGNIVIPG